MLHRSSWPLALALVLVLLGVARAQDVPPDDGDAELIQLFTGISFGQLNFTFPHAYQSHSRYGVLTVDDTALDPLLDELPGGGGYVNVIAVSDDESAEPEWLVQNLPVVPGRVLRGASTIFDLGFPGTQRGVSSLKAEAYFSHKPRDKKPPGSHVQPAQRTHPPGRKPGPVTYFVVPKGYNAQGVATERKVPVAPPPPNDACKPVENGETTEPVVLVTPEVEGEAMNVEQARNQCCPGALANSVQYLKGLGITTTPALKNTQGETGIPKDSLEAQIDVDMLRKKGQTIAIKDMLLGKLSFLSRFKVNGLVLEHQGKFCDRLGNCLESKDVTSQGLTSKFIGEVPNLDFIKTRVNDGADIEAIILWRTGGGHCIRILGFAVSKGIPSIYYQQDSRQGQAGGTAAEGKGVKPEDVGIGWTCLQTATIGNKTFLTMPRFVDGTNALVFDLLSEKKPQ